MADILPFRRKKSTEIVLKSEADVLPFRDAQLKIRNITLIYGGIA